MEQIILLFLFLWYFHIFCFIILLLWYISQHCVVLDDLSILWLLYHYFVVLIVLLTLLYRDLPLPLLPNRENSLLCVVVLVLENHLSYQLCLVTCVYSRDRCIYKEHVHMLANKHGSWMPPLGKIFWWVKHLMPKGEFFKECPFFRWFQCLPPRTKHAQLSRYGLLICLCLLSSVLFLFFYFFISHYLSVFSVSLNSHHQLSQKVRECMISFKNLVTGSLTWKKI